METKVNSSETKAVTFIKNGKRITKLPTGRVIVETINDEPSHTQPQFADACDINLIMKNHSITGEITHWNTKQGQYIDLSTAPTYQEALNIINSADEAFASLPAETRRYFDNQPEKLLEFLDNPKNRDKAIELGLMDKPKNEATQTNDHQNQNANQNQNQNQNPNANSKPNDQKPASNQPL